MILGRQQWEKVSFVRGFTLTADEVQSSSAVSVSAKRSDFTLHLTNAGASRLANYAAANPNTEIPIVFSGTSLGPLKLTTGMDTHTLHMNVDAEAGLLVRMKLGR